MARRIRAFNLNDERRPLIGLRHVARRVEAICRGAIRTETAASERRELRGFHSSAGVLDRVHHRDQHGAYTLIEKPVDDVIVVLRRTHNGCRSGFVERAKNARELGLSDLAVLHVEHQKVEAEIRHDLRARKAGKTAPGAEQAAAFS